MEKELDQSQNNQNIEKDQYGNVVINGETYYSKSSLDKFTTSLQTQNNDLMSKFETLQNEFSSFKSQVTQKERNDILIKAGVREDQINNVSKLMSDIPTEELVNTLDNDRSFDIFRKSQLKTKEQQPKNEETQSKESDNYLSEVFKSFM